MLILLDMLVYSSMYVMNVLNKLYIEVKLVVIIAVALNTLEKPKNLLLVTKMDAARVRT
jgi:hypothetical protein